MSYDSGSNYKYPQQDKITSSDNIDEISMLKSRIALLEKERIEGEFDYHDGGKINCHPQYIKGYNDGYKDGYKATREEYEQYQQ